MFSLIAGDLFAQYVDDAHKLLIRNAAGPRIRLSREHEPADFDLSAETSVAQHSQFRQPNFSHVLFLR